MADNLVLEHLRAIRTTLENIERELGDVRHRVGSMERHLANLQTDIANVHLRLDHQGDRTRQDRAPPGTRRFLELAPPYAMDPGCCDRHDPDRVAVHPDLTPECVRTVTCLIHPRERRSRAPERPSQQPESRAGGLTCRWSDSTGQGIDAAGAIPRGSMPG